MSTREKGAQFITNKMNYTKKRIGTRRGLALGKD
jgi:hypothetical protein